jgi:hypothetical protein
VQATSPTSLLKIEAGSSSDDDDGRRKWLGDSSPSQSNSSHFANLISISDNDYL